LFLLLFWIVFLTLPILLLLLVVIAAL